MARRVEAPRGMEWVRLDTSWYDNPKFLALMDDGSWQAITVYLAGLAYSGGHGLDGFIPKHAVRVIAGTAATSRQLEDAGLWEAVDGGWLIHDWHDYQPTADEAARRSEKARRAAEERWKRRRAASLTAVPNAK